MVNVAELAAAAAKQVKCRAYGSQNRPRYWCFAIRSKANPNLLRCAIATLSVLVGAEFRQSAAAANTFTLNNFRLGLAWTIDFMESNSLGHQVSGPTILALDGCGTD